MRVAKRIASIDMLDENDGMVVALKEIEVSNLGERGAEQQLLPGKRPHCCRLSPLMCVLSVANATAM